MSESENCEGNHVECDDWNECARVLVGTVWPRQKWTKDPLGNETIKQCDKMKDLEILKRLVDFVKSITHNRKCRVNECNLLSDIVGEEDVTQAAHAASRLEVVEKQQPGMDSCAQEYFHCESECCCAHEQCEDKNQAPAIHPQPPVINKTNSLDEMSIWDILEENNCFVDDAENEVDGNNNVNNIRVNAGSVDANDYELPTLKLRNDFDPQEISSCRPAIARDAVGRDASAAYVKNDNVAKNIKITALLIQLELAQYTINQQQKRIRDLHAEMEDKEKRLAADVKGGNATNVSKLENDLSEAMKLIYAQTNQIKDDARLIEELKGSEASLQFELEVTKEENNNLEESIDIVRGVVDNLQDNTFKRGLASHCDVLILHDTFLKHIKTDLFEKQQLRITNVLCHHLSGALSHLQSYKIKPKVVIVHTGTNDIEILEVLEMCNIVAGIHACVTNNDMKLIISNITSTFEESELEMKVHLFNANISCMFGAYDNVTICKSNEPYDDAILDRRNVLAKEGLSQKYSNGRTRLKKLRQKRFPYQYKGKENFNDHCEEKDDLH